MKLNTCVFMFAMTGAVVLAQQKDIVVTTQGPMVTGPVSVGLIGAEMVGGSAVTGAPYSAEAVTETTQTLPDGNRIVNKSSSKIYRDSAGRERREQSLPNFGKAGAGDNAPAMIMISDPVAKVNYSIETHSKTATKMPAPGPFSVSVKGGMVGPTFTRVVPAPAVAGGSIGPGNQIFFSQGRLAVNPESAQKKEDLGRRTMEGVLVEGTRTTTTIPAGQVGNERPIDIVSERWYSSELQVLVMSKDTDPRVGETTYQLTNVSRVEPAASLFEVPSDYQLNDLSNGMQKFERQRQTVERGGKDEF
jgi:hypothetical protein